LKAYDKSGALPNAHQQQPARKTRRTANDILYPEDKEQTTAAPTLKLEMEQYLASMDGKKLGVFEFWQASN